MKISESFFVDADFERAFGESGLTSIDAVFSFNAGKNLAKDNLAKYRSRLQFEINSPSPPLEIRTEAPSVPRKDSPLTGSTTLFLKRYDSPPILTQLRNWLTHRKRRSYSFFNLEPAKKLAAAGINTAKIISYGEQWGLFFEKRSFIITESIHNAESLEQRLPEFFSAPPTPARLKSRRNFIAQLAAFVKKFHQTKYRHRDLYLCHIFHSNNGEFYLIDLARAFKPRLFAERFRIKDIAQLYYSAQGGYFSKTDRLRFYLGLIGHRRLTGKDRVFISKVKNKAKRMARHDIKHGRVVPFAS